MEDPVTHEGKWWRHLLSVPFIWGMALPLFTLDVGLEIYHRICFPLYGIPCVVRRNYIRIDRHKLSRLTGLQKLFCVYCGYANGLIHYAQVIAGRTEEYWCAIQHAKYPGFVPPPHHAGFEPYEGKHGEDAKECGK